MQILQKIFKKKFKNLINKIICFLLLLMLCTGCSEKAAILFNRCPITEENIYEHSKDFARNTRIYYIVLMPQKVESRYLYIQVIKKDNDFGTLAYDLVWSKDIRLKDEEINYFTDYLVLNQKGYYIMKIYSKDNPQKIYAISEFYVHP